MHNDTRTGATRCLLAVVLLLAASGVDGATITARDTDGDGDNEFVLENAALRIVVKPTFGAQAVSLVRKDLGVDCALAGGKDVAKLSDSSENDNYAGSPTEGALYRNGVFYNQANYFAEVYVYASEGDDTATLEDSAGNDSFEAWPDYAILAGEGFFHRAENFDNVRAVVTNGGVDVAKLFDSYLDDTFEAWPDHGVLSGEGFNNVAEDFDSVHAYAIIHEVDWIRLGIG